MPHRIHIRGQPTWRGRVRPFRVRLCGGRPRHTINFPVLQPSAFLEHRRSPVVMRRQRNANPMYWPVIFLIALLFEENFDFVSGLFNIQHAVENSSHDWNSPIPLFLLLFPFLKISFLPDAFCYGIGNNRTPIKYPIRISKIISPYFMDSRCIR